MEEEIFKLPDKYLLKKPSYKWGHTILTNVDGACICEGCKLMKKLFLKNNYYQLKLFNLKAWKNIILL